MMTPIDCKKFRSSMPDPTQSAASNKAVVIGLYGVPGSGKTFLLSQLKQEFGKESFEFYEGSEVIPDSAGHPNFTGHHSSAGHPNSIGFLLRLFTLPNEIQLRIPTIK
jgi:hypothetical protein